MYVFSGGIASNTFVNDGAYMFIDYFGIASNATVSSGGTMSVGKESEAYGITVSAGGFMKVSAGGSADGVTICSGGRLLVDSWGGGILSDVTVLTGGSMTVDSGGILTGSQTFAAGADVTLQDGAGVVFDVSGLTAADCSNPFLNGLSNINFAGEQSWRIAVSAVQDLGRYTLAGGAAGFDRTVTVVNDAWEDTGVTLAVGETKDVFGASHTLQVVDGDLTLIVGESETPETADSGWNNTLYDKKTKTLNERVYGMAAQAVNAGTKELLIDTAGTVRWYDDGHNFVGNSESGVLDAADFTKIELETAAKLSFNIYSGQAAKFTVWQLVEGTDKKGAATYTMKSLQSTAVKGGYAGANTSKKPLLLEAGEYYVSMELSNAKKAGETGYYSVTIDDSSYATEFYTRVDNSDDGDDIKTAGMGGHVRNLWTISKYSFDDLIVSDGWVGFGDAVDYMKFTLESAAKLGFYLDATDAAKFTIWKLNEKTDKNGVTTYSLKSLQSVTLKAQGVGFYWADTSGKPLTLEAGTYLMSMESTNAKKGGSAAYTVEVDSFVEFDSLSAALAMPEADSLAMTDGLSFGGLETDALADVSAASLDKLAAVDDVSAWQSLRA